MKKQYIHPAITILPIEGGMPILVGSGNKEIVGSGGTDGVTGRDISGELPQVDPNPSSGDDDDEEIAAKPSWGYWTE